MKIVVAVDGSAFAETVIPAAAALARAERGELEFFSVFEEDSVLAGSEATARQFKEWLASYLSELVQRTRAAAHVDCGYAIRDGDPATVICDHVGAGPADIVALTTHGRGPVSRSWLGSVADRVVHRVSIPALVVRAREDEPHDITETVTLGHIVVTLDGSRLAEQALGSAVRLAKTHGSRIALLRIVETPPAFAPGYIPHVSEAGDTTGGEDRAKAYLADVAAQLEKEGVRVSQHVEVGTSAGHEILRFLGDNPCDLVCLASHGRTGLSRVLMGSIADKVVRGTTTPVLLTRAVAAEKEHGRRRKPEQALAT